MKQNEAIVLNILNRIGTKGATGKEIFNNSSLNRAEFNTASDAIWLRGEITGEKSVGCCGNGCADYCVSYMKFDNLWKLKAP